MIFKEVGGQVIWFVTLLLSEIGLKPMSGEMKRL
jgi:predicted urease superfamily metal-dependent hydrolase